MVDPNLTTTTISLSDSLTDEDVVALYNANDWSSAEKPRELLAALRHSHSSVTARINEKLIGLANAISDDYLVAYFPHMLVHPDYHRQGVGQKNNGTIAWSVSEFSSAYIGCR